jgi:hypothetical protein
VSIHSPPHGTYEWPFLGTYLLSTFFNLSLLVLAFTTTPHPSTKYDYIHILIASIRTFFFFSLAVISEILRIRSVNSPDTEADQPLKTNGNIDYGTFDSGRAHHRSGWSGFASNPPPTGGWITYLRSFQVRSHGVQLI